MAFDQAEPRLADPRTSTIDEGQLPNRHVNGALEHELLDLVQRCLSLLGIEFGRLLLEQRIDVGVAAVYIGTSLRHKALKTRSSVAKRTAGTLYDVLVALL